jgi:predicted secreted hydrolase
MKKAHNIKKNIAVEITPKDDAFHGSEKKVAAEWWYFDAIFTNSYSIHIGCRTFSRKKLGMIQPFLELYKNGKLEIEKKKRFLFKNFETSKEYPIVKLFKKPVIEFDYDKYKKDNKWIYKIDMSLEDCKANLEFIGDVTGFKIETEAESWTVALPKAKVTGDITYNGKKIKVEGTGYHDHNWNYTFLTALTYGKCWYWGKIRSKNYNIVWANVVKKDNIWDLLAIVNKDQKGFYNINPKNIIFKPDSYILDNKKKTPTYFTLKIDEMIDQTHIKADIEMKVKDLHYSSVLRSPYWRYHVQTSGFISIDDNEEKIDDVQIMEFLKFN